MRVREGAALVAAAIFAGSTTTWALADARPSVDLPRAPGLSTGGPATHTSSTSTSPTPTSTTSDESTTEDPATQTMVPSEDPATERETETETEMVAEPAAPLPEPTSTWQPHPPATSTPGTPTWTRQTPFEGPSAPATGPPDVTDAGGDDTSEPGATQDGATQDDGATVGGDPAAGTGPGPSDESSGVRLPDPLVPGPDDRP